MDFKESHRHTSKDPKRGYIEYDVYVELPTGKKEHLRHGIIDIHAETAWQAYQKKYA